MYQKKNALESLLTIAIIYPDLLGVHIKNSSKTGGVNSMKMYLDTIRHINPVIGFRVMSKLYELKL